MKRVEEKNVCNQNQKLLSTFFRQVQNFTDKNCLVHFFVNRKNIQRQIVKTCSQGTQ